MNWKALLVAVYLVFAPVGCAIEDDDDAPDINIRNEETQPNYDTDVPDIDVDVDAEQRTSPPPDAGTDIDIDAESRTAPAPDADAETPGDTP